MDLHVTVLSTVKKVAVRFIVEMVHVRQADSWDNVQARDVLVVPGFPRIMSSCRNTHVRRQPWYHGLALPWCVAMAVAQRVLTDNFMDLANSMVQYTLKRNHKLLGVKIVDIMVPVSREASSAWDHEPHIRIDIKHVIIYAEICRALVLALRYVCTDVLAC